MKIAIISDLHENFHNLYQALEQIRADEVDEIVCLGDIMNPGMARVLAHCGLPVFSIWGNNDGDRVLITKFSLAVGSRLTMSDKTYDFLTRDGRQIFITHYPALAEPMARSRQYDLVCYGHDHQKAKRQLGDCLIVNPGELGGLLTGSATYAVYDTQAHDLVLITLKDSVTTRTPYVIAQQQK